MLTIETWLDGVGLRDYRHCPIWPPDLYATVGMLLKRSGADLRIFKSRKPDGYHRDVENLGRDWRQNIDGLKRPTGRSLAGAVPDEVKAFWERLVGSRSFPINEIHGPPDLTEQLIKVTLIADEASAGIGVDWDNTVEERLHPARSTVPGAFRTEAELERIRSPVA